MCCLRKRGWPIAMLSDDFVYGLHFTDGFVKGHDDLLIMPGVFVGQFAALAVFEPFFADLVAADVEMPDLRRHASEVLRRVDPDTLVLVIVLNLFNGIRSCYWKFGGYSGDIIPFNGIESPVIGIMSPDYCAGWVG